MGNLNMLNIHFDGTSRQPMGQENWLICIAEIQVQRIVNHMLEMIIGDLNAFGIALHGCLDG